MRKGGLIISYDNYLLNELFPFFTHVFYLIEKSQCDVRDMETDIVK